MSTFHLEDGITVRTIDIYSNKKYIRRLGELEKYYFLPVRCLTSKIYGSLRVDSSLALGSFTNEPLAVDAGNTMNLLSPQQLKMQKGDPAHRTRIIKQHRFSI